MSGLIAAVFHAVGNCSVVIDEIKVSVRASANILRDICKCLSFAIEWFNCENCTPCNDLLDPLFEGKKN